VKLNQEEVRKKKGGEGKKRKLQTDLEGCLERGKEDCSSC